MVCARLSSLDSAFLRLESASAPMHLGALAIFQPLRPVPPIRLITLLGERAERLPALSWRAAPTLVPPGAHHWVADPRFDARSHVHLHRLDSGGRDEAAALAAEVMAQPLDLARPLWQVHVMTGLAGGGFAVLFKLHHALADGLRAVQLGLGLFDGYTDAVVARSPAVPPSPSLLGTLRSASESAVRLATRPHRLARQVLATAAGLPTAACQVADAAGIAASVLSHARRTRPTSPLATVPDTGRGLALLRLDLAGVREVRRRHGGTDHDVLLAVLSSALRQWLDRCGGYAEGLDVRALIPVSWRRRTEDGQHGNRLSGYLCSLPVQEADPLAGLAAVRSAMSRNKAGGPGRGAGAFPVLANLVPDAVHRVVAPLARQNAGRLFDMVVTNVPVPDLSLALHGAPLREVYPIVPLAHGHALAVAASRHRGTVHIGLHTNGPALPDVDVLAGAIPAALDSLRAARGRALPAAA
jgi:WS/DGAT/MGAT family acyltransferase